MLTGLEMMACQNLAVPAQVMQHVVNVESSSNPYAIGVVGGQLMRQPQNLDEAIATVQMLESKGYNYSVGLSQVNRANFGKYGLDTFEKAFSTCGNLEAGSRILAGCYASAGGDWGKAFSCYYSGNFTTGYRDGYVQKIFDSMGRGIRLASNSAPAAQAIPLQVQGQPQNVGRRVAPVVNTQIDDASYRVALRSVAIDTAASAAVNALAGRLGMQPAGSQAMPQGMPANGQAAPQGVANPNFAQTMQQAMPQQSAAQQQGSDQDDNQPIMAGIVGGAPAGNGAKPAAPDDGVFTPVVRGPNDRAPQAAAAAPAAAQAGVAGGNANRAPGPDRADLRQGGQDAAFVF